MNGSSALNEQLIGKFHVVQVEKLPSNTLINSDEPANSLTHQTPAMADESTCASRFQMIRVDRNFGRGRWKVNDYEPPENTPISALATLDHETNALATLSTGLPGDSHLTAVTPLPVSVDILFDQYRSGSFPLIADSCERTGNCFSVAAATTTATAFASE